MKNFIILFLICVAFVSCDKIPQGKRLQSKVVYTDTTTVANGGSITFFIREYPGIYNRIMIIFDGDTLGTLSEKFEGSSITCNAIGAITVNRTAGVHHYTAITTQGQSQTWDSDIQVMLGVCSKVGF